MWINVCIQDIVTRYRFIIYADKKHVLLISDKFSYEGNPASYTKAKNLIACDLNFIWGANIFTALQLIACDLNSIWGANIFTALRLIACDLNSIWGTNIFTALRLIACDLNSIWRAGIFIVSRFMCEIQSCTTAVGSDNWHEKFIYSNITRVLPEACPIGVYVTLSGKFPYAPYNYLTNVAGSEQTLGSSK